jgi:hypothetical protein
MADWDRYKIAKPKSGENGAVPTAFDLVAHIAHTKGARRILEDGFLRAGLVNDGSKLDTSRTCVTFFSANTWGEGYIYGNVAWRYDWETLVRGKNVYWVEDNTNYHYPIYRFLISGLKSAAFPGLTPYDPEVDEGPLRNIEGKWFYNADRVVSEFLIDGDLELDQCKEFDFVQHHAKYCRSSGCVEKGMTAALAEAQTIAYVLGNEIRTLDRILQRPARWRADKRITDCVPDGLAEFSRQVAGIRHQHLKGTIKDQDCGIRIVRGAMSLFGAGQRIRARELISDLENGEVFVAAITEIVREHFSLPDWELYEE